MQGNTRNVGAILGFAFSLAALVPALWLGYQFAFNYDAWFSGRGMYLDNAGFTGLFVVLIFLPFELVIAIPALILSLIGTMRALRKSMPHRILAVAGLVISLASLALSALLVLTALSAAS